MQEKLPIRKYPRLKDYDYSQYGPYFVTLCIKDKRNLLGRVDVGSGFHARPFVELTDLGVAVQKTIEYIYTNDKRVEIQQYVIMPNHVHMIVALNTAGYGSCTAEHGSCTVGRGSPTLQAVVGRIKSYTTKLWNEMYGTKHEIFWQRSFHDHIIRSESDYQKIWQYIDENPMRWMEDCYYTK